MSRFEMNSHDRYRVKVAREALVAAKSLDMSDDRAMARMIGRLETVVSQLVEMVDEAVAE